MYNANIAYILITSRCDCNMRRNIKRTLPSFDVISFTESSPTPVRRRIEMTTSQEQNFVSTCISENEDIPVEDTSNISIPFVFDEGELSGDSDSDNSDEDENAKNSTIYSKRQENSARNWESVREDLLKAVIESECIPDDQMCTNCRTDSASYRCLKCGIGNFFCESCVASLHSKICVFHVVEQWKVSIWSIHDFVLTSKVIYK